jgi:pyruvate-formate lyase-activating enzyme
MREIQNKAATLLGEAVYNFQDGKNIVMDIYARADRRFGRKLTVEMPNDGGRETAEYYFNNGRLLELRVTIPPGGDYGSPNIARFIDSVAFFPDMANQDSIELTLPE